MNLLLKENFRDIQFENTELHDGFWDIKYGREYTVYGLGLRINLRRLIYRANEHNIISHWQGIRHTNYNLLILDTRHKKGDNIIQSHNKNFFFFFE